MVRRDLGLGGHFKYVFLFFISLLFHKVVSVRTPCYLILDLVKIYGRISQKSKIGHIIPLKSDDKIVSKLLNPEKIYWELLFDNDKEELTFNQFSERINVKHFEWPMTINKNRREDSQPFLIPVCRDINHDLIKPFENTPPRDDISNYRELQLNAMISNQAIDKNALLDVFDTFSSRKLLTKRSFSDRIKTYSPLMALWDWDSFVKNMSNYTLKS